MARKAILVPILLLTIACAVHKAPQLSPLTTWELNTADQLAQLERDYRQLFTDIGSWHRAGQLTKDQVDQLNIIGRHVKTSLETANRLFKAWQKSRDADARTQVVIAVGAAAEAFVQLVTKKAQIVTGGKP